jgi:hypothetical protein
MEESWSRCRMGGGTGMGEDERGHERLRRQKSMLSADTATEDMERTRLITVRSEGKEMRLGGGMR